MATPTIYQHRARVSALSRHRAPEDPELLEATRDLRAAKLEEHIARVVDAAPPLTAAQRDRLASLLHGPQPTTPAKALRRSTRAVDHLTDLEG